MERIKLILSKKNLNPVLKPFESSEYKVEGILEDGSIKQLSNDIISIEVKTKYTSGNEVCAVIKGNKIIPKSGGIAVIKAKIVDDGRILCDEKEIVVRPFYRDYHQILTLKIMLDNSKNILTFEECLKVIKKIDNITRNIPKIIYLVGWQEDGHDYQYPDWSLVNSKLKRAEDKTALDSLKWLIREGRKYNTTVSLHINMLDAYKESILWDEYEQKDIFARDEEGNLKVPWSKGSRNTYHVCYTREWEEGLAQRRIDNLCKMIPELTEGHTIHIDAFHSSWERKPISPYHNISVEQETETQRKIFEYWRNKGFDITSEATDWERIDPFIGLQPMAWWYSSLNPMEIPECLYAKGRTDRNGEGDPRFGESMHGEEIINKDPINLKGFKERFCRTTLPWYYLNRLERLKFKDDIVYYSDNVKAYYDKNDVMIEKDDYVLREGNNIFVPALWNEDKHREIIAYSEKGYENKKWILPREWNDVSKVNIYYITLDGLVIKEKNIPVNNNSLTLSLMENECISIVEVINYR